MNVKDLIQILGAWDGDAEVEVYTARGGHDIVSVYSKNVTFRDGRPLASADKLVTIDVVPVG